MVWVVPTVGHCGQPHSQLHCCKWHIPNLMQHTYTRYHHGETILRSLCGILECLHFLLSARFYMGNSEREGCAIGSCFPETPSWDIEIVITLNLLLDREFLSHSSRMVSRNDLRKKTTSRADSFRWYKEATSFILRPLRALNWIREVRSELVEMERWSQLPEWSLQTYMEERTVHWKQCTY